jgi:predicted ArsR family transcriptional regulator
MTATLPQPDIRPHAWLDSVADPVRLQILRLLVELPDARAADLADALCASNQTARRHLDALVALGVVVESPGASDGATPGRPAARYSLPADVRESVLAVMGALALSSR